MPMNIRVVPTEIAGVRLIEPESFEDQRGFFFESYSRRRFAEHGLDFDFVQDNHSRSARGVLRGFHYQDASAPQWRLVRCSVGEIWDVVVDLRPSSATYGKWMGFHLSSANRHQLLIPPEFAHGFCVLSEFAEVQYKCSNYHSPTAEHTLAWNDPEVGVRWPIANPTLSVRDAERGTSFAQYRSRPLFPIVEEPQEA
jgi:dTDP-4-dehydrorhamnose 3,5-epimerase